jgi:hypothetical protein
MVTLTGIENASNKEFSIYPNPSNGLININFSTMSPDEVTIRVYNTVGQLVFYSEKIFNNLQAIIDLHNQSHGIYFLEISSNQVIQRKKITIE